MDGWSEGAFMAQRMARANGDPAVDSQGIHLAGVASYAGGNPALLPAACGPLRLPAGGRALYPHSTSYPRTALRRMRTRCGGRLVAAAGVRASQLVLPGRSVLAQPGDLGLPDHGYRAASHRLPVTAGLLRGPARASGPHAKDPRARGPLRRAGRLRRIIRGSRS